MMPHARAPPPPAGPGRGRGRGEAGGRASGDDVRAELGRNGKGFR
jgi:hypothetical protein